MDDRTVPHIKVEVEFRGEMVSMQGAFFIDAIDFLCEAEKAVRRWLRLTDKTADDNSTAVTRENLQKLLGGVA